MMAIANNLRPEMPDLNEEDASPASTLQLQLAAGVVGKLIERNGSDNLSNVFWDDDVLDSVEDGEEYVDPELWDPDEETLPEMREIEWNIYECN